MVPVEEGAGVAAVSLASEPAPVVTAIAGSRLNARRRRGTVTRVDVVATRVGVLVVYVAEW